MEMERQSGHASFDVCSICHEIDRVYSWLKASLSLIMSNEHVHISKKGSVLGVTSRCKQCFCFVIHTRNRFFNAYFRIAKLRNSTHVPAKISDRLVQLCWSYRKLCRLYVHTKQMVSIVGL